MSTSAPTDEDVQAAISAQLARTAAGCWLWRGCYVDGQPDLQLGTRHIRVRRWLFQHAGGQMTAGQACWPLCTRQACVAPAHTQVGRRGAAPGSGPGAATGGDYAGPRAHRRGGPHA